MFNRFKLRGNRTHIRTDIEMLVINQTKADEAFKKYKKTILDESLKARGFLKYKTMAYVRKNAIDVLEYIDLQKERYGSKTFTVNYALMPLYVPHDYIDMWLGDRLGQLINGKDIWWDYSGNNAAKVSFQNVSEAIEIFVLPWFEKYSDEEYLVKELKKVCNKLRNEKWIKAIDDCDNRSEIINDNIQKLKLPKRL